MKNRSFINVCKNALGTVFLLASAFFVCSTLLSMRAVLADPIAPMQTVSQTQGIQQSPRANNRTNPRARALPVNSGKTATRKNVAAVSAKRNVVSRNVSPRTKTNEAVIAPTRNVVARTTRRSDAATRTQRTRNVRARTSGTTQARISLSGDAIRGSRGVSGTTYTHLTGKLYTGNYSSVVDPSTGLISEDAYNTCVNAYYTCMDEICTARNEAQRRCACAGRVTAFAEAENALQSANEELIKVSGQLALLIANKGKDVSAAFKLTDAEKVMNCASWREAAKTDSVANSTDVCDTEEMTKWCQRHGEYDTSECSCTKSPSYCSKGTNGNLFDVADLNGAGSDILASLASWADQVKENTDTFFSTDDDSLANAISGLTSVVSGITGSTSSLITEESKDTLAETWGYELFGYAHNRVCARVLDSCFNGIYEACGTPPQNSRCANGASGSCPYNYNSYVEISSAGEVEVRERGKAGTTNATATCFGYSASSGDPYASLRGPVADARRSIMEKYLLDANADCDAYGEQLKTAAKKITYQKVAAQQALQKKRLEFQVEEERTVLADAINAGTNFNECVSELLDCYETQARSNSSWSNSRIKTYCAQISNSPHCYETMICNPSVAQFKAVIDVEDNANCDWNSSDYTQNTCRNVVTLHEILYGVSGGTTPGYPTANSTTGNSMNMREKCLRDTLGDDPSSVRNWTKESMSD